MSGKKASSEDYYRAVGALIQTVLEIVEHDKAEETLLAAILEAGRTVNTHDALGQESRGPHPWTTMWKNCPASS
jgi:hypothetical protein